jgi:pentatricopeptide repeat protein
MALELLDEFEALLDGVPSAEVYGAAMGALAFRRRRSGADATPADASGSASDGDGGGGAWQECLDLLERMEGNGVQPTAKTYESVVHACQAAGEWQHVYNTLYTMRKRGVRPRPHLCPVPLPLLVPVPAPHHSTCRLTHTLMHERVRWARAARGNACAAHRATLLLRAQRMRTMCWALPPHTRCTCSPGAGAITWNR